MQGAASRPKLSKRVYFGILGYDQEGNNTYPPREYWRWYIAEKFGWTLDYVDSLSMQEMENFYQIEDGRGKANAQMRSKHGN